LFVERFFVNLTPQGSLVWKVFKRKTKLTEVSFGSVVVPDLYNVSNRQGEFGGGESNTTVRKFGYYANANVGWKEMFFLEGSFRYDFTSLFYKSDRDASLYSYPYYGFDASFILTQAFPALKGDLLNYAKLRAGWNKNGNDNVPVYGLDLVYPNGPGFPYGNTVGLTVGNTLPAPDLKPEFVTSFEVGAELQMFKNRVNVEVTGYLQNNTNQILNINTSNATGFTQAKVNAADFDNKGLEFDLRLTPVLNLGDFRIDLKANLSPATFWIMTSLRTTPTAALRSSRSK